MLTLKANSAEYPQAMAIQFAVEQRIIPRSNRCYWARLVLATV